MTESQIVSCQKCLLVKTWHMTEMTQKKASPVDLIKKKASPVALIKKKVWNSLWKIDAYTAAKHKIILSLP